jgi:hypothetical protein
VLDALPVAFATPEEATELAPAAPDSLAAPAAPAAFGALDIVAVLAPEALEAPVAFVALAVATFEAPEAPDLIGATALDADEAALLFNGKASTAEFPIMDMANAMARNFIVNGDRARPAAQNCGSKECLRES